MTDISSPAIIGTDLGIDLESLLDDAPPEEAAHIVKRHGTLGAGALIEAARESGVEVEALCGHKFVPKYGHAPDHLTPCRRCLELWGQTGGTL